jgi:hypothetical protein
MKSIRVNLKPLSVNKAWKGRRFKTDDYKVYANAFSFMLPKTIEIPEAPYQIEFWFGMSLGSDWDNPIKPTQDIIAKKYKFNDKLIYTGIGHKIIVKKGDEFIAFKLTKLALS